MFCCSRKLSIFIMIFLFSFLPFSMCFANINLPAPQTKDGVGIFDALKKRSSTPGGGFPIGKVSAAELSTILWAASGLNRGNSGWTVPMVKGKPPYVDIYVASENGVFRYEWQDQSLKLISSKDIRADIGMQNFVRRASDSLILVANYQQLNDFTAEEAHDFTLIAAGAMSQNIYLAATSLKLSVRYIHSIKADVIKGELLLSNENEPIGLLLLGK